MSDPTAPEPRCTCPPVTGDFPVAAGYCPAHSKVHASFIDEPAPPDHDHFKAARDAGLASLRPEMEARRIVPPSPPPPEAPEPDGLGRLLADLIAYGAGVGGSMPESAEQLAWHEKARATAREVRERFATLARRLQEAERHGYRLAMEVLQSELFRNPEDDIRAAVRYMTRNGPRA